MTLNNRPPKGEINESSNVYRRVVKGEFAPADIIIHKMPLEEAEHAYEIFDEKRDGCIKGVWKPNGVLH